MEVIEKNQLAKDPMVQFERWYQTAKEKDLPQYNAMTLATANHEGVPSARMVLLKSFSEKGFVFYTNYNSRVTAHPFLQKKYTILRKKA